MIYEIVISNKFMLPDLSKRPFSQKFKIPNISLASRFETDDVFWLVYFSQRKKIPFGKFVLDDFHLLDDGQHLLLKARVASLRVFSRDFHNLQTLDFEGVIDDFRLEPISVNEVMPATELLYESVEREVWKVSYGQMNTGVLLDINSQVMAQYGSADELLEHIKYLLVTRWASDELQIDPWHTRGIDPFLSSAFVISSYLNSEKVIGEHNPASGLGVVDVSLRHVDQDDYDFRNFRSVSSPASILENLLSGLEKTDRAEKRHQEIFQEISEHLRSLRIEPLMSKSIDIAFYDGPRLKLVEIKSSSLENFEVQYERGLVQIAKYSWRFARGGQENNAYLLIEKPLGLEDVSDDYYEFADSLGVSLVIWNDNAAWPNKALGLLSN